MRSKSDMTRMILQPRTSIFPFIYDYVARVESRRSGAIKNGSAAGINLSLAKTRATHEALERFFASLPPDNTVISSISELRRQGIDFWHTSGFPRHIKDRIGWLPGRSLLNGKVVMVPASCAGLETGKRGDSTGLAIHTSYGKALGNALAEVMERRTAREIWDKKRKAVLVDLTRLESRQVKDLVSAINQTGFLTHSFLYRDKYGLCTVISAIRRLRKTIPFVAFGSAAGLDKGKTILKSLEEAAMMMNSLEIMRKNGLLAIDRKEVAQDVISRIRFYAQPENEKYWRFLTFSPKERVEDELGVTNWRRVIDSLVADKEEIIVVKLQEKKLAVEGLHLVRVLMPGYLEPGSDRVVSAPF